MSSPADLIVGLYEKHAQAFDRDRGRSLFEKPWLDRFLSRLPSSASVLDIGCGHGEPIAAYLIETGCKVTGVDSAPSLVSLCRERFPAQHWTVADMRGLALGRQFDGIIAWDSFFHLAFEDQRRMFPRFRDHAASRATLMFTSGPRHGEAIGSYCNEPLYHASLAPEEYCALLDKSGFEVIAYQAQDPDCGGHTVWLAQSRS